MKGIEKIKKKIMGDANASAKKQSVAAKKEVKLLQAKHKTEHDTHNAQFDERTAALVEGLKQKSLAQARLDVKKDHLRKREEIMNAMIGEVIEKLDHKSKNYERFLTKILDDNLEHLSGNVTVICNKADESLAKRLIGTKAKIEQGEITGGFLLEDAKGKRVDESIAAVLERKRNKIRQEIVHIIR